jgi:hypothetical protein
MRTEEKVLDYRHLPDQSTLPNEGSSLAGAISATRPPKREKKYSDDIPD